MMHANHCLSGTFNTFRSAELTIERTVNSPIEKEMAGSVNLLDSVVPRISDINISVSVNGQSHRPKKIPRLQQWSSDTPPETLSGILHRRYESSLHFFVGAALAAPTFCNRLINGKCKPVNEGCPLSSHFQRKSSLAQRPGAFPLTSPPA